MMYETKTFGENNNKNYNNNNNNNNNDNNNSEYLFRIILQYTSTVIQGS